MRVGLLEGVMGRFLSGEPLYEVPEEQHRFTSIREHLSRLFNTRHESLSHIPDYGLPDITVICDNTPDSIGMLQRAIKETIDKYEPRLKQVQVVRRDESEKNTAAFSVSFDIIARIVDGPTASFRAQFSTMGPAQVDTLQRRQ